MKKEEMKKIIYKYIKKHEGTSFAELNRILGENSKGNQAICNPNYLNIIFWCGMSEDYADAVNELLKEKKIFYHPSSKLIYLVDGTCLKFPIVKRLVQYKTPHWIPLVFCAYPDEN